MSLPMQKFDPANPLPRRTISIVLQTGPGQASRRWLWYGLWLGLGAAALLLLLGAVWLAAFAVSASAFAVHGLATKARQSLDLGREKAPGLRRILRATQIAAIVLGITGVLLGALLVVSLAMGWGRIS